VGRLDGKTAVVTGAARGMGAAILRRFVEEGATVVATDVGDWTMHAAVAREFAGQENVAFVSADVADAEDWDAVVARASEIGGPADVLVNNAGILGTGRSVHEEDVHGWDQVLDVNLKGVFLGMRAVLPGMLDAGRGSIVNTSSMWGLVAAHDFAAYHASKGAVTVLTKNAAVTYADRGIRVNSVHPGMIDTPMNATMPEDAAVWILDRIPLARAGKPTEIAEAVVFLASDESSYVTGVSLPVDGGFVAM